MDPSCAHGFAPAELLLGRQLVFPVEIDRNNVDFTGNFFVQIKKTKKMPRYLQKNLTKELSAYRGGFQLNTYANALAK